MTKTARRKQRKAQRKAPRNVQRATPVQRATGPVVADPFDLSPADIQRAAESQRTPTRNAQRRGQHKAPVIGGKPDYSETLHRHGPPVRDPGRCAPVAADTLYFEAWQDFLKANSAQYKPRHFLGIFPVWTWRQ
jgi:hypothetical protein